MLDKDSAPRLHKHASDSTTKRSEVSDSDLESADESKGKGIFVRISPKAKRALERAAMQGKTTYTNVIESLLEHLDTQEARVQEKILRGVNIAPLKEFEDLVAQLHRAQHAYENKRYYYAIKTYREIADKLETDRDSGRDSSEELLEVCNYRLGHSWIRLSYDLRREALSYNKGRKDVVEDRYSELYDIALDALSEALRYLEELSEESDTLTRLIKHYNMACCHSLKAQYLVESRLDSESQDRLDLCEAANDTEKHSATEKKWSSLGENWRKTDREDFPVDTQADKALDELKRVYSASTGKHNSSEPGQHSNLTSEGVWVVDLASRDEDLIFLRSDKKRSKIEFEAWKDSALTGDNSIGRAIRELLKGGR